MNYQEICNKYNIKNLRGANLRETNLCGANLRGENLRETDLCRANLRGANLRETNLCGVNLYKANLHETDLCGANLRKANLYETDLCGANLREANLRETNLCGANLNRTDLYRTNLTNIIMNWNSHELIAQQLFQFAKENYKIRMIAGLILISKDWCWEKFISEIKNTPEVIQCMKFLHSLIKENDNHPHQLNYLSDL